MASIRRTLSPLPQTGAMQKGEVPLVASPLSKSSTCTQNYSQSGGVLSSFFGLTDSHSILCRIQAVFSQRSSRPQERSKSKGHVWKRAFFHFFICFMIGIFIGLTPFVSMNLSLNLVSKHQAFSFEVIPPVGNAFIFNNIARDGDPLIKSLATKDNTNLEVLVMKQQLLNGISDNTSFPEETEPMNRDSDFVHRKLLIIVTPSYRRPFQAYYLSRLMHTLRLVQPPLLWIVVEMSSQSAETADILRRSGVMYRHLVCGKNVTSIRERSVHQRNVALSHIETHRLDGIVYFADDDNMYSVDLFEQMREIRRFGTWIVAMLTESKNKAIFKGPVCNGSQVIGWHTNERTRRFWRFHVNMSGFAFNSTILWDPKRWHRPTLEPIRQIESIREGFQESTFVEQVVEDESQMEGLPKDCSRVMVWHLRLEGTHSFYPGGWFMKKYLDVVTPLG